MILDSVIDIENWLDSNNVTNYIINDDLTVDVQGYVDISLNKLTSLKGCPKVINKDFYCNNNYLVNLEYCPNEIYGSFNCCENKITSLLGSTKYIKGNFNFGYNFLTSLYGCSIDVDGNVYVNEGLLPIKLNKVSYIDVVSNLIKYQGEYGIWSENGEFNDKRFEFFLNDLKSVLMGTI